MKTDKNLDLKEEFELRIDTAELERTLRARISKNYFADSYATASSLRDMCAAGRELAIPPHLFPELWTALVRRMKAHLHKWMIARDPSRIILRNPSRTDQVPTRVIKNCRDYLLHSAASEILEGIQTQMAERAYQKSIRAMCRATDLLERSGL